MHFDKDYGIFTYNYWWYDEKSEQPSQYWLNLEAFAHFIAVSVMDDPEKMALIEQYLPNAYETYNNIVDEMREQLNASRR